MTARRQWTIVGAVVGVLLVGLLALSREMKDDLFQVTVGSKAPAFQARVLGQRERRALTDYSDQVVLLNIWATTCPPCVAEIPSLERLYREFGPRGLRVVAVSVDGAPGSPVVAEDSIQRFVRNLGVTFAVLRDTTGRVQQAYQTTGYPETFIIGPEGEIRHKTWGAADWTSAANRALVAVVLGLAAKESALDTGAGGVTQK